MRFLLIILCLFAFNNVYSQIVLPVTASQYVKTIEDAITLIKKTDTNVYNRLDLMVDTIDMWLGAFSSCDYGWVFISRDDILLGVQNVAAVLVHESQHIWIWENEIKLNHGQEEVVCYQYELNFLNKVPNCDWRLKKHAIQNIKIFSQEAWNPEE